MLLTEMVVVKWHNTNRKHYENLGYKYTKRGEKFKIPTFHLSKGSNILVDVLCDYCLDKIIVKKYSTYIKEKEKSIVKKDCCDECRLKKVEETSLIKYGTKYPFQNKQIRKKAAKTKKLNLEYVKSEFLKEGYILLEDEYVNSSKKMKYICPYHPTKELYLSWNKFKLGRRCHYCNGGIRLDFNIVKQAFKDKGYILLEKDYKNSGTPMRYKCPNHPNKELFISYDNLKSGRGCRFCAYDNNRGENHWWWNEGHSEIGRYLRTKIYKWKLKSMENCNYKCVLTKDNFDAIHHLYSFDLIIKELFNNLKINTNDRNKVNQFSKKELHRLEEECLDIHFKYPLGVCLRRDLHKLFHDQYGYGCNTPKQFEEFKERYYNGEFDELLENSSFLFDKKEGKRNEVLSNA